MKMTPERVRVHLDLNSRTLNTYDLMREEIVQYLSVRIQSMKDINYDIDAVWKGGKVGKNGKEKGKQKFAAAYHQPTDGHQPGTGSVPERLALIAVGRFVGLTPSTIAGIILATDHLRQ